MDRKRTILFFFGVFLIWGNVNAEVYLKFNAKDPSTKKMTKYTIEDLPSSLFETAAKLMWEHFMPNEPWSLVREHLGAEIDFYNSYINDVKIDLNANVSLACFKSSNRELVGFNILTIEKCGAATASSVTIIELFFYLSNKSFENNSTFKNLINSE